MKTLYFFLAVLLFASALKSQDFERITNFHNYGFYAGNTKIINVNEKLYHFIYNYDDQIDVYRYDNDKKTFVGQTEIDICDETFVTTLLNDSLLITIYKDRMSFFNFLNSKTITISYPNNYIIKYTWLVHIIKDFIYFDNFFSYDFLLNKFIFNTVGNYLYRSNNNYYYSIRKNQNTYLTQRQFNDTTYTLVDIKPIKFNTVVDELLYVQDTLGSLYTIDKNNLINLVITGLHKIIKIIKLDDNRISILGINNDKDFIYTYSLTDYSLINSYYFLEHFNLNTVFYQSNKLFVNIDHKAYYFDYKTNTLRKISNNLFISNNIDSLVFMKKTGIYDNSFKVLNTNTLETKELIIPFDKTIKKIVKLNNTNYLYLFKNNVGYGLYKYDFITNSIKQSNYNIEKNEGIMDKLIKESDFLYCSLNKNKVMQIIDETENENIDVFKFKEIKIGRNIVAKHKIYYIVKNAKCSDETIKCGSLYCYDINSNVETILDDNIILPKHYYSAMFRLDKYIIVKKLRSNSAIIINTENNKKIELSEFQKQLFRHVKFHTKDYFYSNIDNTIYKVSIESLNYWKISEKIPSNTRRIVDNEYFYYTNNKFYYNNGFVTNVIYESDSVQYASKVFISPDKKYFIISFMENETRHYLIYNRTLNTSKIIEPFAEEITNHSYNANIFNNKLIVFGFENEKKVYLYNLQTNVAKRKEFDSKVKLFSVGDDEIHFNLSDKIIITNNDLEEIETLPLPYKVFRPLSNLSDGQFIYIRLGIRNYRNIIVYDREKRQFSRYFTCQDSIRLCDAEILNDKIYCLARNDAFGYQIYSENLKEVINSNQQYIQNTSEMIETYPNPSYDYINIATPVNNYKIINTNGLIVKTGINISTTKINIQNLPAGLYIISSVENNRRKIGKFVKIE